MTYLNRFMWGVNLQCEIKSFFCQLSATVSNLIWVSLRKDDAKDIENFEYPHDDMLRSQLSRILHVTVDDKSKTISGIYPKLKSFVKGAFFVYK